MYGLATARRELVFNRGTVCLAGLTLPDALCTAAPWVADPRAGCQRCDALHYPSIRACLAALPEIDDQVAQWPAVRLPAVALPHLRDYQEAAAAAWEARRAGVIVMPTGTGKTEVALRIMAGQPCATLVVCPVRPLMYQWHQRIRQTLGYDAGIIGDNLFDVRPLSVTTYRSACIHMERLGNQFALLIFDECHHLPGGITADAARMAAAPWRLGLTATPMRADGKETELAELIGPRVYEQPLAAARAQHLADYAVIKYPARLSDGERATYDRLGREVAAYIADQRGENVDFAWLDAHADAATSLRARMALRAHRQRKAIEDRAEAKLEVLEEIFRNHPDSQTIVFAGSNEMARRVALRFLIPCLLNHCGKRERAAIIDGFAAGRFRALVANQVLDEGVDLPAAKLAVVLGGKASGRQAVQRLGRILRKTGAARAILYEIVCDNTGDVTRSRQRRRNDAYAGTRHLRL
jgi:superfamily II DNA or RNA helicase